MGSQRTLATFEANIADDAVFDEAGELSVPGGRNICERLVAVMRADAIPVTDPEQHKWYGWAFTASINGALTWLMLQDPDPWLLLIENRSGKSGWFRKAAEPSDATLSYVQVALDKTGVVQVSHGTRWNSIDPVLPKAVHFRDLEHSEDRQLVDCEMTELKEGAGRFF